MVISKVFERLLHGQNNFKQNPFFIFSMCQDLVPKLLEMKDVVLLHEVMKIHPPASDATMIQVLDFYLG